MTTTRKPMRWTEALEGFCYTLLSPLLLHNSKTHTSESGHTRLDTHHQSDIEIDELANSSPKVDANSFYISDVRRSNLGRISRIAPNAVAKSLIMNGDLELHATNLVRTSTCIPVPFCERIVRGTHGAWLVQEFIPGYTLWQLWPELGWWKRFRIALTLRYYVYQLRSMHINEGEPLIPGPPTLDGSPKICNGRLFTSDGAGPFLTYRELSRWYQNRLLVMQKFGKAALETKPFDDNGPLVFTHLDLHPQNLILGNDGQLWVIDWADAGWYPPWFEAASMKLFLHNRTDDDLKGWEMWIPFIAGTCERPGQLPFIRAISYSLEVLHSKIMNLIDSAEQTPELPES